MTGFKVVPIHRMQCARCGEYERPLLNGVEGVDERLLCWDCAAALADKVLAQQAARERAQ